VGAVPSSAEPHKFLVVTAAEVAKLGVLVRPTVGCNNLARRHDREDRFLGTILVRVLRLGGFLLLSSLNLVQVLY
jgi:hypothetical protein